MVKENSSTKREIPEIFEGVKYLDPKYEPAFRELFDDKVTLTDFLNTILHLKEGSTILNSSLKTRSSSRFQKGEQPPSTFSPTPKTTVS